MKNNKTWTYKEKLEIVKEFREGASIPYLNKKYGISSTGTISKWNKKYESNTLAQDKRGRKKQEIEDIDILKKSYALLMEIRKKQQK